MTIYWEVAVVDPKKVQNFEFRGFYFAEFETMLWPKQRFDTYDQLKLFVDDIIKRNAVEIAIQALDLDN